MVRICFILSLIVVPRGLYTILSNFIEGGNGFFNATNIGSVVEDSMTSRSQAYLNRVKNIIVAVKSALLMLRGGFWAYLLTPNPSRQFICGCRQQMYKQ